MRHSGTAIAVVAALGAVTPVVALAHHKPGHGQGPADLTIAAKPGTTIFQGATVISGRLKEPNNSGRLVTLNEDEYPFGNGDRPVATATTDANGDYSFTRRPVRNTSYRAIVLPLPASPAPVLSSRVLVTVRIKIGLRVSDTTPRSGQLVRFRGRACPDHDGLVVRIQRRTATGAFRTVRRTRLTAASRCSVYSRRFRVFRDGVYRATADDADHARGFSGLRSLDVP